MYLDEEQSGNKRYKSASRGSKVRVVEGPATSNYYVSESKNGMSRPGDHICCRKWITWCEAALMVVDLQLARDRRLWTQA